MNLKGYNTRTRLYFVTIIIFILTIIIIYSVNGIVRSQPVDVQFESENASHWTTAKPPQFKPLGKDYRRKLFDLDFKYIIEAEPCSDRSIQLVIVVTSHHDNVETRSAMRRAFSPKNLEELGVKRVFLLGETPSNSYMTQASIVNEGRRFQDIIQGNFLEAYRNLTYKHIMGLKWVSENCNIAKYVIKMDDDIVIDVEKVVHFLNTTTLPNNLMAGYILKGMKPIREPANKWYVTQREYSYAKYPSFLSGWFYVTTPKIASKLYLLSHYFDYFWIDDVYVTGILTKNLKLKFYDLKKYFTVYPEFLRCCINDVKKRLSCDILVGPNGGDNNLFFEFNEAMKVCGISKCDKRSKPINETCVAERKTNLSKGSGIIERYKLH